jgi:hypothetical protein
MNIPNAIKLRDQLLSLPGKFDYGNYVYCLVSDRYGGTSRNREPEVIVKHTCDTAACVAGWCAVLNVPNFAKSKDHTLVVAYAQDFLELTPKESAFLFYPNASYSYDVGYEGNEYVMISEYTLEDAIDRLNYLINKHSD